VESDIVVKKEFYSNGKLLISGEYLVLQGALALATPVKFGQRMEVTEDAAGEAILQWKNIDHNGQVWADVQFSKKNDLQPFRQTLKTIDVDVYNTLQKILNQCRKSNPAFLKNGGTTTITNYLGFDRNWGLGSSSTLLNNLAQFAHVDAFTLNREVFGGSGYDIACAKSGQPLLFKIDDEGVVYDTVHFRPPQTEQIYFVHLGNKQDSKAEVEKFLAGKQEFAAEIEMISEISEALLFCDDFRDFMQLIDEHEEVMQFVLQREKIKTTLFNDFNGVIKSLGAWGGDFIMAASEMQPDEIKKYFSDKQYQTIFSYDEMVL